MNLRVHMFKVSVFSFIRYIFKSVINCLMQETLDEEGKYSKCLCLMVTIPALIFTLLMKKFYFWPIVWTVYRSSVTFQHNVVEHKHPENPSRLQRLFITISLKGFYWAGEKSVKIPLIWRRSSARLHHHRWNSHRADEEQADD